MSLLLRNLKLLKTFRHYTLISATLNRTKASSTNTPNRDEPVKFSTSDAKKWDSMNTFVPEKGRRTPPTQPIIVILSVSVFLVYFLLLREENELDEALMRPLEDSVPNIKEFTLKKQIEQYDSMGLDSAKLKQALSGEIKKRIASDPNVSKK